MKDVEKTITTIPQMLDVLEEICEEYTYIDERRPIIRVIEFVKRQQEQGKRLEDIIYWIKQGMPDDLQDKI
jgi:hypothetical protein|tara:strand:- start:40 stop:252 length:213 start_codon:yes stop_codon:yes gene_type:complete